MNIGMSKQIDNIKNFAVAVRKNILEMAVSAGASSAHFGGALSITEIVSTLFAHQMKIDKKNPKWEERDRFILSKGHACLAYYAALSEIGYISKEELSKDLDIFERVAEGLFQRIIAETTQSEIVWIYTYLPPLPSNAIGPLDKWPAAP